MVGFWSGSVLHGDYCGCVCWFLHCGIANCIPASASPAWVCSLFVLLCWPAPGASAQPAPEALGFGCRRRRQRHFARPAWQTVPRSQGRLRADDIGLVINPADPYSVEVGEYYMRRRGLKAAQVLRVELPLRDRLSAEEFERAAQPDPGAFRAANAGAGPGVGAALRGGLQLDHRRPGTGLRCRAVPQQLRSRRARRATPTRPRRARWPNTACACRCCWPRAMPARRGD